MPTFDCSIVIINWNTKDLLSRCLSSISVGAKKISYEIFVVDNGSSDGSQGMVQTSFPEVHLIANTENRGFGYANNQAFRKAQGRYFFCLNSDAYLSENSLDELVSYLDQHPSIGMAVPQLLCENGDSQPSLSVIPDLLYELAGPSLRALFPQRYYGDKFKPKEPVSVQSLSGAAFLIRKAMADQIGIYDEDYFFYYEETDWCFRTKKAGWEIFFLPQIHVYHGRGKSTKSYKFEVRIEYWRSRYLFFKKNHSRWQYYGLRIGLLLRQAIPLPFNLFLGLFNPRIKQRAQTSYKILRWHWQGCPEIVGLPGRRKSGLLIK